MRKILIFQHVAYEPLGTLTAVLKDAGIRMKFINFHRAPDHIPSIDKYEGLIILGGPMGVYEHEKYPHIETEISAIKKALEKDIPILGICLGAQLIAAALGSTVRLNRKMEIGWCNLEIRSDGKKDPLISLFENPQPIFQWHRDTFDLPKKAIHLAQSKDCENQAFRFGDKVYGFQFHLEVDPPMIKRWLSVPTMQDDLKKQGLTSDWILKDTALHIDKNMGLANKVFGSFIKLFTAKNRRLSLRSGH